MKAKSGQQQKAGSRMPPGTKVALPLRTLFLNALYLCPLIPFHLAYPLDMHRAPPSTKEPLSHTRNPSRASTVSATMLNVGITEVKTPFSL